MQQYLVIRNMNLCLKKIDCAIKILEYQSLFNRIDAENNSQPDKTIANT